MLQIDDFPIAHRFEMDVVVIQASSLLSVRGHIFLQLYTFLEGGQTKHHTPACLRQRSREALAS